jgi:hypothetical protein
VQFSQEHKSRIEQFIGTLECPRDYECYRSGFEMLSRAQCVGETGLIECLGEHGDCCPYGLPFGDSVFCQCPLRKYIAETLGR